MTTISPSLLSCDFLDLKTEIQRLNNTENIWIHLDIMDSHFVPNLTFGEVVLKNLKHVTEHKLDAHFMVTDPDFFIENFKNIGLHNFTFHWEALTHHDRFIQKAKEYYPSVGISLNPSTPINVIPDYILKKIDLILVMSVNPGFGGQSFIPESIEKVKALDTIKKRLGAHFEIQVDGGVSDKNAKDLITAGATNLVAGSYIFSHPQKDYNNRIQSLR